MGSRSVKFSVMGYGLWDISVFVVLMICLWATSSRLALPVTVSRKFRLFGVRDSCRMGSIKRGRRPGSEVRPLPIGWEWFRNSKCQLFHWSSLRPNILRRHKVLSRLCDQNCPQNWLRSRWFWAFLFCRREGCQAWDPRESRQSHEVKLSVRPFTKQNLKCILAEPQFPKASDRWWTASRFTTRNNLPKV